MNSWCRAIDAPQHLRKPEVDPGHQAPHESVPQIEVAHLERADEERQNAQPLQGVDHRHDAHDPGQNGQDGYHQWSLLGLLSHKYFSLLLNGIIRSLGAYPNDAPAAAEDG
jgi:hypothetical protein